MGISGACTGVIHAWNVQLHRIMHARALCHCNAMPAVHQIVSRTASLAKQDALRSFQIFQSTISLGESVLGICAVENIL